VHDIQAPGHHATRQDLAAARREVAGLRAALETRHTIGLAQGILMARHTLSVAQAFDYLRRRSQSDNVKLRQIAVDLVAELDATRRSPVDGHALEPRE
jgi:AmiR/NasT family two-component response regulator